MWDRATARASRTFPAAAGPHDRTLTFSPDGRCIGFALEDGMMVFHDLSTGEKVFACTGHKEQVMSARYSPDGTRILTTGGDGTARLSGRPPRGGCS